MTAPVTDVSSSLEESLKAKLLSLPFDGFAQCMVQLLERLGYTQVQSTGRTGWKGRNQHGGGSGFDLTALAPCGMLKRRVVISLKQFQPEQKVYQRTLDELRGACLRVGAGEALLITTSSVSLSLRTPQASPLAPVAVIEGDELLTLLVQHRVGIIEVDGYLTLDTVRFERLTRESAGNRRASSQGNKANKDSGTDTRLSPVRVIVQVEPLVAGSFQNKALPSSSARRYAPVPQKPTDQGGK